NDQVDRGSNVEGGDPHIAQTGQRFSSTVGVQSGHHHVAGLCCLDRDLGRFQITDLPHHDDIRVLAKEGAQRLGKIQALLGVDVDLVDTFQVDFDRVFSGGNVPFHGVQDIEAGIQRYRLTRAGRAGDQNHALGLV